MGCTIGNNELKQGGKQCIPRNVNNDKAGNGDEHLDHIQSSIGIRTSRVN